MKKLLSLPPNLVECFHDIEKADQTEWFCTSDPIGSKLGSGGGTAWLLEACCQKVAPDSDFLTWLGKEKRILLHAGGQSRRLPGYAPSGKILTPIPVFRWARGQRLSQNLLSLQLPLYEHPVLHSEDKTSPETGIRKRDGNAYPARYNERRNRKNEKGSKHRLCACNFRQVGQESRFIIFIDDMFGKE